MSPAFLSGVTEYLPQAEVTVDRFHIVQTLTKRLDEVRKKERREQEHPKSLRLGTAEEPGKREPDTQTVGIALEVGGRSERYGRCLSDQGEATLDPAGPDAQSGSVAHHELP